MGVRVWGGWIGVCAWMGERVRGGWMGGGVDGCEGMGWLEGGWGGMDGCGRASLLGMGWLVRGV